MFIPHNQRQKQLITKFNSILWFFLFCKGFWIKNKYINEVLSFFLLIPYWKPAQSFLSWYLWRLKPFILWCDCLCVHQRLSQNWIHLGTGWRRVTLCCPPHRDLSCPAFKFFLWLFDKISTWKDFPIINYKHWLVFWCGIYFEITHMPLSSPCFQHVVNVNIASWNIIVEWLWLIKELFI